MRTKILSRMGWRRGAPALATTVLLVAAAGGFAVRVAGSQQQLGWVAERRGAVGKDLNAVYFTDSKRGWAAGDAGLVLHTEDGGVTWSQQLIATSDSINDIYFRDKEDGYLLAGNMIFRTDDRGLTWREVTRFPAENFGGGVAHQKGLA